MTQFPSVIDVSSLDGATGFKVSGALAGDDAGVSVASAGDVNGDGLADLIVGASEAGHRWTPQNHYQGAAYVIFGTTSGFASNIGLDALNGSNGFKIPAPKGVNTFGVSVASAGDVNGDGFDDMVIGGPGWVRGAGSSVVVFGHAGAWGSSFDTNSLDGTNGFIIRGPTTSVYFTGSSVSSAGDVNGDGFDDVIVGAPGANLYEGAAFVVFGKASGWSPEVHADQLGVGGLYISGAARPDQAGASVAGGGDWNGDGVDDLLVGAPLVDANGAAYAVFGHSSDFYGYVDLGNLDAANGVRFAGPGYDALAGTSVASAGDVNGDGYDDLIVGAPGTYVDGVGYRVGEAMLEFGSPQGPGATLSFVLKGLAGSDEFGSSVASAGDVNGDGFDDLIVGAPGADTAAVGAGASYVVFGKAAGWDNDIDLSALDGTNGFRIDGAGGENSWSVSSAGDINGDGLDDLIVGAPRAEGDVSGSGAAYVILGQLPDTKVNRIGTIADQSLVGGNLNDRLSGMGGDDKLFGHGGKDVLRGGAGDDLFVFTALTDSSVKHADTIKDFSAGDRIDLHLMDPMFEGHPLFHLGSTLNHAGDVIVTYDAATDLTSVSIYFDFNAKPDSVIHLSGDHSGLTAADFIL